MTTDILITFFLIAPSHARRVCVVSASRLCHFFSNVAHRHCTAFYFFLAPSSLRSAWVTIAHQAVAPAAALKRCKRLFHILRRGTDDGNDWAMIQNQCSFKFDHRHFECLLRCFYPYPEKNCLSACRPKLIYINDYFLGPRVMSIDESLHFPQNSQVWAVSSLISPSVPPSSICFFFFSFFLSSFFRCVLASLQVGRSAGRQVGHAFSKNNKNQYFSINQS